MMSFNELSLQDIPTDEEFSLGSESLHSSDTEKSSFSEDLLDSNESKDVDDDMDTDMVNSSGRSEAQEEAEEDPVPEKCFGLSQFFRPCSLEQAQQALEDTISELLQGTSTVNTRVEIICDLQVCLQFPKSKQVSSAGFRTTCSPKPVRGARLMIKKVPDPDRIRRLRILKAMRCLRTPYLVTRALTPPHVESPPQSRKRHRSQGDIGIFSVKSMNSVPRGEDNCEDKLERQSEMLQDLHIHDEYV